MSRWSSKRRRSEQKKHVEGTLASTWDGQPTEYPNMLMYAATEYVSIMNVDGGLGYKLLVSLV